MNKCCKQNLLFKLEEKEFSKTKQITYVADLPSPISIEGKTYTKIIMNANRLSLRGNKKGI